MRAFCLQAALVLLFGVAFCAFCAVGPSGASAPAADNLPAISVTDEEVDPEAPNVVINAPKVVQVGDMIVVDVSGSNGAGFDWEVIPAPPSVRLFNDGQVMCAATGPKAGKYLFIVSCARDGRSNVKTHVVNVRGNEPPVPDKPGVNVASKVRGWCEGIESPTQRDDAMKLAQAFASLATVIEGGAFENPAELVIATKAATKGALGANLKHWLPLLDGLMVELKAMAQAGMLQDISAHAPVWKAVAQGLNEYAQQL
jgi:hypothetical protein